MQGKRPAARDRRNKSTAMGTGKNPVKEPDARNELVRGDSYMMAPVRTGESQFAFAEVLSQLANKRGRCAKRARLARDTRSDRSKRVLAQTRTRAQVSGPGAIGVIISMAGWWSRARRSMRSHDACTVIVCAHIYKIDTRAPMYTYRGYFSYTTGQS